MLSNCIRVLPFLRQDIGVVVKTHEDLRDYDVQLVSEQDKSAEVEAA